MAQSEVKRSLLELKLRIDPNLAVICVHRLATGDSPYSLVKGKDKVIGSMGLAHKLNGLLKSGKLQFLFELPSASLQRVVNASASEPVTFADFEANLGNIDDMEASTYDTFRFSRLKIIKRFEELCPAQYFTIKHLRSIGIEEHQMVSIMKEYDLLQLFRIRAEVTTNHHPFGDGLRSYLANFPLLIRYAYLLCIVYCLSETHGDKESEDTKTSRFRYCHHAAELIVRGDLMESDEHLKIAGEDILRYRIWQGNNITENAYFDSLKRLKRKQNTHDEFVQSLKEIFRLEVTSWLSND